LTGSSNGVRQASEGRHVVSVRIEVLAIFLFRNFPQCFLLDDFALRMILKTALNIAMHRSRDVFERSKRAFFCFASDFFALGADRERKRTGSPLCVGIERWCSRMSWRSSTIRERKRSGANGGLRTCSGQLGIVVERHADLILSVRLLESMSQAPCKERYHCL
jgi:hypothetical protein